MNKLKTFLSGGVKLRIYGPECYRFLKLCSSNHVEIEHLTRLEEGFEFVIPQKLKDEIDIYQKKCNVKAVLICEYGLPFLLRKMSKRLFGMIGFAVAVLLWYMTSKVIWNIEIDGNCQLSEATIRRFLKEENIVVGTAIRNIETERIEEKMRENFPEINWVSLKLQNTGLQVYVTENTTRKYSDLGKNEQKDIIAPYDCKIEAMIIRNGTAMVKIGDEVPAGTVIVKGEVNIYNDDGTVREKEYCTADGDIMVTHLLQILESLPQVEIEKHYTGREDTCYKCYSLQNLRLQTGESKFQYYDQISQYTNLSLFLENLFPQLKIRAVTVREFLPVEVKRTREELQRVMSEKIHLIIKSLEEKGVQIIEKNGTMGEDENLWVYTGEWTISELLPQDLPVIEEKKQIE